ncbi:hypothetical protein F4780DRAFT_778284 [Xylariomycetidae sp. FL0641]|nr:hypothetical protein F4780DRAFT_784730 [Xylariomycetidae sp. FL0641]KAI0021754.1 hypothetical protein F4780DRAFT_778284 [Xylariomycetidae sp. FL0641]
MAPPKGQPKPSKAPGNAKRLPSAPASRPVVVPAIPLALMQRQPSHTRENMNKENMNNKNVEPPKRAPAVPSSSNRHPVSSLEAALIDHDFVAQPKPAQMAVNGIGVEKPGHATATATATANAERDAGTPRSPARQLQANGVNGTNGLDQDHVQPTDPALSSTAASVVDAESVVGSTSATDPNTQGVNDAYSYASQPLSAASSDRHDLPASFQAVAPPMQQQPSADHLPDPANIHGMHLLHHNRHHVSNGGGIMFGGFAGSHTPSPVPPPGGFMPPPTIPVTNGDTHVSPRANGHAHSNSNGFPGPVNGHFPPEMMPMSTMDTYRQVPAHAPQLPFDVMHPGAGRYGPPTPHSFHGSHTSGEPNGMENGTLPYAPNGSQYPGHGHHEHLGGHPRPPAAPFPPFMPPEAFVRRPNFDGEMMDSIAYFRSQFDNGELSDCVLELVYASDRQPPVKISGHKLILARSPALKQHIMDARTTDLRSQMITIVSEDTYLRSDAWWQAVQRLYMHPLLDVPPLANAIPSYVDFAGTEIDRFEFCLGYAAAGHLLEMQDILIRGLEVSARLLNWKTVETAMGFVFENTSQRHFGYGAEQDGTDMSPITLEFGYGPETKILLLAIINFLVNEFPSNFELDTSVKDNLKFSRIPATASSANERPMPVKAAPAIARGTTPRHAGKQNRLSSIKFGDLPAAYPEDNAAPHKVPAKCSSVLSRVLLNLPFDELCAVLTSGSNGVSGWNTAQDRYHAVADVVAEREARRLRAVEAVRAGAVPDAQEVQQRLSAHRRHAIVEAWDVLNWQEQVIRPRGAEVPRVVRKWVPQFDVANEPTPQPRRATMVGGPTSMV